MRPHSIIVKPSPVKPETADRRIPPRDRTVTRDLLERWYRDQPDKTFLLFEDGARQWTYAETYSHAVQVALGLQTLGVAQDDRVVVGLPNSQENIRAFLGINFIGAVYVPINNAYRGKLLAHAIALSRARVAIVEAALLPHLADLPLGSLEKLIVVGDAPSFERLPILKHDDVLRPKHGTLRSPARRIEPWDLQSIMLTSGTTGPSKGVLSSYLHLYSNAGPETWTCIGPNDRFLIPFPMFHVGGTAILFAMLAHGASAVFTPRFDASTFWQTVRGTKCTVAFLLGVMAAFLEKAPDNPLDRDHPLRLVFVVPLGNAVTQFGKRFHVDVYTIFNMTEVSTPLWSGPNPSLVGTSGRPREGVEVRLVDTNDCETSVGEVGELVVRTDRPWGMNSGYADNAEATAAAWRNGWLHTGDLFRKDADENFFFVDRLKDAIRRRGENISSFEIEVEVLAYPTVKEVAAIGVPSSDTEEEVMICVAPTDGASLDPEQLIAFLEPRIAYFMVPRFIRIMSELPKTPTAKIMKQHLRAEGVTPDTWDRRAADTNTGHLPQLAPPSN
ncbi:MAG: AMP-binding protein [Xanthobacteraceae bacterium]